MSILRETIDSKASLLADALMDQSLAVSELSSSVCTVSTDKVTITVYIDDRGGEALSTIEFTDGGLIDPKLHTHVIFREFPEITEPNKIGEQRQDVACEIDLIVQVLRSMHDRRMSFRDLYFFQSGYNTAYTEYASGDWD